MKRCELLVVVVFLVLGLTAAVASCHSSTTTIAFAKTAASSRASPPPPPPPQQSSSSSLLTTLQHCLTPAQVLDGVGSAISLQADPAGHVARLSLVRLVKLLVAADNQQQQQQQEQQQQELAEGWSARHLDVLVDVLLQTSCATSGEQSHNDNAMENIVQGCKALSVISRLMPDWDNAEQKMVDFLVEYDAELATTIQQQQQQQQQGGSQDHLLSGLDWAVRGMSLKNHDWHLGPQLSRLVSDANLPFTIHPGLLLKNNDNRDSSDLLSVQHLTTQVDFSVQTICTATQKIVPERRQTAWQGDDGVGPFEYSGKSMPRQEWSPTIRKVRDTLARTTGQYYDCCLLNLYPDGGSGMRYHVDPDQGTFWDYDTAVVSIGATRRFSFRAIDDNDSPPHNFVVLHGDVCHMFGDCQGRFQHAVKKAEQRGDQAPRISLVYKRTLSGAKE